MVFLYNYKKIVVIYTIRVDSVLLILAIRGSPEPELAWISNEHSAHAFCMVSITHNNDSEVGAADCSKYETHK